MKLSTSTRIVVVALICLGILAYRWVSFHFWFPLNNCQILVNGDLNHPVLYDYEPGKSLNGDIFLRNQDHGTQYLISVKKNEVSVISEDEDFVDFGVLTLTRDDLSNLENSEVKVRLSNPSLFVGDRVVEFTSAEGERWHISY
jgi:hypothetical protein